MGGGMGGGGMGGGGMGGGMGGGGMGGGGMGGGMSSGMGGLGSAAGAAGVVIDAQGVLRTLAVPDAGLSLQRRKAAAATLPGDLQTSSKLRMVALSRLEAEVAKAAATGRGIPDEFEKLAGLTRIQYVFIYPGEGSERGEIVIAGPAEGWMVDATGRVVGIETGAPTLLLEDLAAAIRAFPPGQPRDHTLGCSIDPKQEGLAAMQTYLRKLGRINPRASSADEIVSGMRQALGTQVVRVDGVSPATHFAQVMVEADYRMKLIGIGLERPPVKMATWIELASAGSVAANALQRWYFVPDYQCVRVSEDDLAIELVGRGVKLVGADEAVLPDGRRMSADRADRASKMFTDAFTKKYPEIAARNPVYAQLRNLVDMAVAAAYLQEHDAYGRTQWGAEAIRDEKAYPIERHAVPLEVETAINAVWRQNRLLTPIGGGVTMQPTIALESPNLLMDEEGTVAKAHAAAVQIPAGRWWW
ncbi:MAG: DUF1598 domain-containing protein [Planctomycetia bacterium]